jgi:hypothetical protein
MTDVVKAKALPWITTPDQAMAWGVAFGLDDEIGAVLSRSIAAGAEQPAEGALFPLGWQPAWYLAGSSGSSAHGSSGHLASGSGGVFSASAIPDPGSIMAALGSIASPSLPVSSSSSSSSSFSSGSFGGGGGGGGGGAGGGF